MGRDKASEAHSTLKKIQFKAYKVMYTIRITSYKSHLLMWEACLKLWVSHNNHQAKGKGLCEKLHHTIFVILSIKDDSFARRCTNQCQFSL